MASYFSPYRKQVLEHPGRTELEAEPAHLVVEVGDAARLNGELGLQGRPAGVADDGETPHQHAVFFTRALRQLVGPAVMVEGAGRYDLDLVAPGAQPQRRLPHQRLRAAQHARAEAGRDEGQLHLGAGGTEARNTTPA